MKNKELDKLTKAVKAKNTAQEFALTGVIRYISILKRHDIILSEFGKMFGSDIIAITQNGVDEYNYLRGRIISLAEQLEETGQGMSDAFGKIQNADEDIISVLRKVTK